MNIKKIMKRTDAQIYILGHKPLEYGYWDNSLYTPLQVGADFNPQFLPVTDNTGNNIGEWNKVFAEFTGMYWAAKNAPDTLKYVGTTQYRRRININENTDFDALFENYDVLCSEPLNLGISVYDQYAYCHSKTEIETLKSVVLDLYPDYADAWNAYIENSSILLYSTAFVMRREDLNRYADFFTAVAFETLHRLGLENPECVRKYTFDEIKLGRKPNNDGKFGEKDPVSYQMQIGGFWQERLATLFIFKNFKKIGLLKFEKFEGV